jgi:hypothetical protein
LGAHYGDVKPEPFPSNRLNAELSPHLFGSAETTKGGEATSEREKRKKNSESRQVEKAVDDLNPTAPAACQLTSRRRPHTRARHILQPVGCDLWRKSWKIYHRRGL